MKQFLRNVLAIAILLAAGAGGAVETVPPEVARVLPSMKGLHPVFKDDPRVKQTVTIAEADIRLGALLKLLSRQTSVPLKAETKLAHLGATLGVRNRPLDELLSLISTHFGFTWRRGDGGYVLWKDRAAVLREMRMHNEDDLAVIDLALRAGKFAHLSPEQMEARREQILKALQNPRLPSAAQARMRRELEDIGNARSHPVAFQLLMLSPDVLVERLMKEKKLTFSSLKGEIPPALVRRHLEIQRQKRRESEQSPLREMIITFDLGRRHEGEMRRSALSVTTDVRLENGGGGGSGTALGAEETAHLFPATDPRLRRPAPELKGSFRYPAQFTDGPMLGPWLETKKRWPEALATPGELLLSIHKSCALDVLGDSFMEHRREWRPKVRPGAT